MSKGAKIVININYNASTFIIGLFLAISLPAIMIYSRSLNDIKSSLESGNYQQAMMHIGGYFDKQYIYLDQDENSCDVVIFNALTLMYNSGEEDDETVDETAVHKAYCGYLFNMHKDYETAGKLENNQTVLLVYDKDNEIHRYQLLDYDGNNDGEVDSIATQSSYNFIFFEVPYDVATSVSKLEFVSVDGSIYKTITFTENLNFDEQFFQDVNSFMEEYNRDYTSSDLERLDNEFRANSNYQISSNSDIIKNVNKEIVTYVIIYFVVIYLIGDSLFGFRVVIGGIKKLIRKISKKKDVDKVNVREVIEDIYCMLTVKLEFLDPYDGEIKITYSNSKEEIKLVFNKENNYIDAKRVMAGTYTNYQIDIDSKYEAIDLLDKLVLTSFSEEVVIKIKEKKENRNED